MRAVFPILAAVALAACATTPPMMADDPAVTQLRRGYEAARAVAALFAPYLPSGRAARLRRLGRVVEAALAAARSAADHTAADHTAALDRAAAAAAAYRHAAGQ